MALVYDTSTSSNSGGAAAASLTWSHTMAVGSGGILVVAPSYANPSAGLITGITYNGVTLTKIDSSIANLGVGTGRGVELWYLLSPATGANNIVVTASGATAPLNGGAISLTGASGIGTSAKNSSTSATSLAATTSSGASDIVVGAATCRTTTFGVGGSQTSRYNTVQAVNFLSWGSTQAGGASVSSTFTQAGAADNFAIIAVPVTQAAGGTPTNLFFF
ncbi:hypothetical protein UFOVP253_46 [uncultured Caudovirales phage]|uniref:Uncharacterized protein n=1 Tax=uncultured Caudovirales phage TaxID=2100421 RepID=A0A6J5LI46_9CAUD|nr:hypothetical protein UFOVP253_46 [uncultured Caudovirales phage]